MNPLQLKGKKGLNFFYHLLCQAGFNDSEKICRTAHHTMQLLGTNGKSGLKADPALLDIEKRWYNSLPDNPDYSVYAEPIYLADTWCCWDFYARQYLSDLFLTDKCCKSGLQTMIGNGAIIDVGNGLGFATAALKYLFPMRRVIGTNLPGTAQWQINEIMSAKYGYELMSNDQLLEEQPRTAMIFASEYFEHFEAPISHFNELQSLAPNVWVTANSFGAKSPGHFDFYQFNGGIVEAKKMGRLFGKNARELGYSAKDTKLWNNRPSVWVR